MVRDTGFSRSRPDRLLALPAAGRAPSPRWSVCRRGERSARGGAAPHWPLSSVFRRFRVLTEAARRRAAGAAAKTSSLTQFLPGANSLFLFFFSARR